MLTAIGAVVGSQPILALFLAIGLGYAVGQINILGFSLGIGAVLFVGLAIGAFAPKAQIAGPIGLIGLTMFLYGIGILYRAAILRGTVGCWEEVQPAGLCCRHCRTARGARAGCVVWHPGRSYAGNIRRVDDQHSHTPSGARRHRQQRSVDWLLRRLSIGVIGPILCFYFLTRRVKPVFPAKPAQFHMGEVTIERLPAGIGTLGDLIRSLPDGVQVSGVRHEHRNLLPDADMRLQNGDGLLIVADKEAAIAETAAILGRLEPGRIGRDRGDLSYQRFFVSKANMTGMRLADLPIPPSASIHVLHVRRYDVDLVPAPELMLEIGDRVGVIVPTEQIAAARALFGDTVKSAAEFSYVSLGFGMVLGVLLGLIPIPLPGIGTVTLGIGGGPLIVALIVGRLRAPAQSVGSCRCRPTSC